jgi:tripartite-type tricarboxylate transporter receptor subunit TctC
LVRRSVPAPIVADIQNNNDNAIRREEIMRARTIGAVLSTLMLLPQPGAAQDWPTKPMTLVIPFAPGGQVDTLGRIIAAPLGEILQHQVVVENVGGAGGMLGASRVAKAAPDGYQFVLGSVSTHAQNQTLYKKPQYNVLTDFAPVGLIGEAPLVLITRKDLPAGNLQEFISHARANAEKMQYGSAGVGSATHLACALLNIAIGANTTHVPYRGGGPAMQDLLGGRIDYACNVISSALPQIKAGTIRAMAILSRGRSAVLPELASAHEQGLTDFDVNTWNAIFLPGGTPAPIVEKLNRAIGGALNMPDVIKRADNVGVTLVAPERRSTQYLAQFVRDEIAKWERTIRAAGIAGSR